MISQEEQRFIFEFKKNTICMFEIFHIAYAFTSNVEHLDKLILPAKYVYFLCSECNISFKYHYFHPCQYEEINFCNFIGGRMLMILLQNSW